MPERIPVVVAVCFAVAAAASCRDGADGSQSTIERAAESADGRRAVVRDGKGIPVAKLRRDGHDWKVYDSNFVSLGEVRGLRSADAGGRKRIRVYRYDGPEEFTIQRDDRGVWDAGGRFRIERTGRGWAVFDAKANWIGRLNRREGQWRLRQDDGRVFRIQQTEKGLTVTDGRRELRAPPKLVPTSIVLALALDDLDALDRVAVGAWLEALGRQGVRAAESDSGGIP